MKLGDSIPRLRVAEDYELYLRIAREYPICSPLCGGRRIPEAQDEYIAQFRIDADHDSTSTEKPGALYSQRRSTPVIAFLDGLRTWREQYGRQLASELAHSFSTVKGS